MTVEGRTVPGLGDPNVPESFSVWGVDVSDPAQPKVVSRIKTGLLVGAPVRQRQDGRRQRAQLPRRAWQRRSMSPTATTTRIERIDLTTGKIVDAHAHSALAAGGETARRRAVAAWRCRRTAAASMSPRSGLNAIGVLDTRTRQDDRAYPDRLVSLPRRALARRQATALHLLPRLRQRPQRRQEHSRTARFSVMRGVLSVAGCSRPTRELGSDDAERAGLQRHRGPQRRPRGDGHRPSFPTVPGKPSEQIKYVVFITKENHTYDTIFDHVPGANDDPSLLRWGFHQTIAAHRTADARQTSPS